MTTVDPGALTRLVFEPGPTQESAGKAGGRTGRDLPAAVGTAAVLIGSFGAALFLASWAFVGLVALLCLLALWELAGALARAGLRVLLGPAYLAAVGMVVAGYAWGVAAIAVVFYVGLLVSAGWTLLADRSGRRAGDFAATALVLVWVPFCAAFVVAMLARFDSPWPIVAYVAVVVASDIGGYAVGSLLGRHAMAPDISPKKSWEGFAGSLLFCLAVGLLVATLFGWSPWWGIVVGIVAALAGTIGDLVESVLKRRVGLKDMSSLLPGHGGIMDRVDSLLMAAPAVYLMFLAAQEWA